MYVFLTYLYKMYTEMFHLLLSENLQNYAHLTSFIFVEQKLVFFFGILWLSTQVLELALAAREGDGDFSL